MNIFNLFQARITSAVEELAKTLPALSGLDLSRLTVEPPRDASHGDIATNVAMVLAKPAAKTPRQLAELFMPVLAADPDVLSVNIAGPGFINLKLRETVWPKVLHAVLQQKQEFGASNFGNGKKVNVEFVSANPTGPLHVGHCRGAVFGDSLASLLSFVGFNVTREYYINDAGAQIDTLARSVYLRYREARGENIGEIPSGLYPGDYLVPVGQELAAKYKDGLLTIAETEWLPIVGDFAMEAMMNRVREDLAALNIRHDVFTSEKSLHDNGAVSKVVNSLRENNKVYSGRLPPPKGEVPDDWEDREQTLFRTTEYGDDVDRPLVKSDGSYTYFASDVAYTKNKIDRGYSELVYVLGADHGGYVKRLQAVGAALAGNKKLDVIVRLCQLVRLLRNGEPVKMSKRAGEFVTLRDVVDEVGQDVVRFMMLYRKNEAALDFDFAKVTEQSKDNPVFYVQYAHARICSVLRKAVEQGITVTAHADFPFELLTDPAELVIVRTMAGFPRLLEAAATAHEPHRISFYLYDLASEFHSLWNMGKELPQLRFIMEDNIQLTLSRLALLCAIRYCLANGLRILGVTPSDEM